MASNVFDGDIVNIDFIFFNEKEEEVERALEGGEADRMVVSREESFFFIWVHRGMDRSWVLMGSKLNRRVTSQLLSRTALFRLMSWSSASQALPSRVETEKMASVTFLSLRSYRERARREVLGVRWRVALM